MTARAAWFTTWACNCCMLTLDRDELPTRCPTHDTERLALPEWTPVTVRALWGLTADPRGVPA